MMRKTVNASKLFLRKKTESRIPDGTAITDGLEANAELFTNMPYKTSDLVEVNKKLNDTYVQTETGDKIAIAELKTINEDWISMYGNTADAVSMLAKGNKEIILKAGMTPTSGTSHRKQKPERAANLYARPGKGKGTCAVSVDAQPGTNGYIALATDPSVKVSTNGDAIELDANGVKIYLKACSRSSMQFDGLPGKMELCVSMFTFNSAGSSPLSNSEEMVTQ